MEKTRNQSVDVLRGIAMLLVVLGHTMSGCTENSESSLVYNIIWSLQMPLFMLISGYVTKFSRKVDSGRALRSYLGKRTLSYLLPWAMFTFLVRGLIMGHESFLDIKYIVYHMDSGYWFLFSLWTIAVIFGIAQFVSEKVFKKDGLKILGTMAFCAVGAGVLVAVALVFGLSFLCIKLTLYYIPFYLAGFLYGKIQSNEKYAENLGLISEVAVAISFVVYLLLITRNNTFESEDSIVGIGLRAVISLLGCISVCGIASKMVKGGLVSKFFAYIGANSLEIYLVHYMFLSLIQLTIKPEISTAFGIAVTVCNFIITVLLTLVFSKVIGSNKYLKFFLFGKK